MYISIFSPKKIYLAQKFITTPKINVFKEPENDLKLQNESFTFQMKRSQNNSGSKRSCDFQTTNDFNKRIRMSEESSRNVSILSQKKDDLAFTETILHLPQTARPHCSSNNKQKGRITNTSQHKQQSNVQEAAPNSQDSPDSPYSQNLPDPPDSQDSPDPPESSKEWTYSQTREQQLKMMKVR